MATSTLQCRSLLDWRRRWSGRRLDPSLGGARRSHLQKGRFSRNSQWGSLRDSRDPTVKRPHCNPQLHLPTPPKKYPSSGAKNQPKEEVLGRISLRGQALQILEKEAFWHGHPARTSMKNFVLKNFGLVFRFLLQSERTKGAEKASCGETVVQKGVFGESVSSLPP